MITYEPTEKQTVQVRVREDGAVNLHLDRYVVAMSAEDYKLFVDYLNRALPLVEERQKPPIQKHKLRLVYGGG